MPSLTTAMMIEQTRKAAAAAIAQRDADDHAAAERRELPSYGRFAAMTLDELVNETKRVAAQLDAHYDQLTGFEKDGLLTHLDNASWAALMRSLQGNANWQLANDGTLDTILHCCDCGHPVRFEGDRGTFGPGDGVHGARVRAAEWLRGDAECDNPECAGQPIITPN
jgi:hypothetical protein